VDIKFRRDDLVRAMKRTLPHLGNMAPEEAAKAEKDLLPLFKQVAVQYAALHDTPGVMRHKGVISAVVPWAESREFFAKQLRRRVAQERLKSAARLASPGLDSAALRAVCDDLKALVDAAVADEGAIAMDSPAVVAYMKKLRATWIQAEVARLAGEDMAAVKAALA
jgi:acetyl-CoA carboxylase/biotin carboxylase 1